MKRIAIVLALAAASVGAAASLRAAGPALDLPSLTDKQVEAYAKAQSDAAAAGEAHHPELAVRAHERAAAISSRDPGLYYNLACNQALAGQKDAAFLSLMKAAERGWRDADWPKQDTDLTSLRGPRLDAWLAEVATLPPEPLPRPDALGEPAADAAAIDTLAQDADAKIKALSSVVGPAIRTREKARVMLWRAASWDAVAAAHPEQAAVARTKALLALSPADGSLSDSRLAPEVERRAGEILAATPSSEVAAAAELARAMARNAIALDVKGGDATARETAARQQLERSLLLLASAHESGPAVESALVQLIALESEDMPAASRLLGRLRRQVGDDEKSRLMVTRHARGTWYELAGLPPFEATTLDGTRITPAALKGRVTLVDFWATWCGPCKQELPHVKEAWSRFHDEGLDILGVSLDVGKGGDATAFKDWCSKNGVAWPQVYDGKQWDAALAQTFGVKSIPFPLLVGKDGTVVAADDELRGDKLLPAIEKELARGRGVASR